MMRIRGFAGAALSLLALMGALIVPQARCVAEEEKFDVLQIGAQTYKNVTVTTKTKDYIFILHSTGMANLRVKELPPELRHQLGYVDPVPPKSTAEKANDWAKETVSKIPIPKVKALENVKSLENEVKQAWINRAIGGAVGGVQLPPLTPKLIWCSAAALLVLYLFYCLCCALICVKVGKHPGLLIWLPILQAFPLLKAAGMSYWWFLALPVPGFFPTPVLNPVAGFAWCVKIAKARGKGGGLAFLLILPIINIFAFLYLAFSNSSSAPAKDKGRVEIMTLETA